MALFAAGVAVSTLALTSLPASAATARGNEWWLSKLGVTQAWATSKGAGVTVAVLSDGVDASQSDLTGIVKSGPDFASPSQSSGQYFGQVGTGLASIVAGHGHGTGDSSGVIGVAPLAKILSVQVTLPSDDPLLTSVAATLPGAIAQGIRYAVAHGATVIDLPLDPGQPGTTGSGGVTAAAGGSAAERAAVKYALAKGVVLVAPAGDDGAGSDAANYPAAYPGVIAVGAFGKTFAKAPWTSRQSYVTVTAAGVSMVASANTGGYQTISSTSAASAVVAGIAALIRSKYPKLSVAEVRQALTTSTVFRGSTAGSGSGTVNAAKALAAAAAYSPAGSPAGSGALPWVTQAAPAPANHSLTHSLIRNAIASAALLVLLLLLIALYVATSRRRAVRKQEAIAAEWTRRQAQPRYPHAGVANADPMLEYFAAPSAASGVQPSPPAGSLGRPVGAGSPTPGTFAAVSRPPAAIMSDDRPVNSRLGGPPPVVPWDDADAAGGLPSRPAARRPVVAGSPPWGPAVQPDSDLPWAAAAVPDNSADFGPDSFPAPAGIPARVSIPGGAGRQPATPIAAGPAPVSQAGAGPAEAGVPAGGVRPGRALQAAAAARAGRAAAAQAAQAAHAAAQPPTSFSAVVGSPANPAAGSGPSLWDRAETGAAQPAGHEPSAGQGWLPAPSRGTADPEGSLAEPPSPFAGPSMTGRLDWRQDAANSGPIGPEGSLGTGAAALADQPAYPPQSPGGPLPVRQPRQSAPAANSPSGSLWERPAPAANTPAEGQDPGSRPIFVWNPGDPADRLPSDRSGRTGELRGRPAGQWPAWPPWDAPSPGHG
jgi:hypothetical protein